MGRATHSHWRRHMAKDKYDIIVVGAGPAGSTAARRLASKGLKVLIIEEHKNIGVPVHCSGWLNGCPYTEKLIDEFGREKIITKVNRWRVWTPSGEFAYEIEFDGGYFLDRVSFDRFFAQKAVQAGADMVIATKVTDLIKEDGNIIGVIAERKRKAHRIHSDIVIACDGSKSIPNGIAKKSGILEYDRAKSREYTPAMQIEFMNMKDVEPGVIEIFFGSIFDKHVGNAFISHLEEGHGMIGFGSYQEYLNVKNNHPVFKERLKNAMEFGYRGGLNDLLMGESLSTGVMPGLMICGDAVGYHGIIPGAISAEIAADVALKAFNASDFSRNTLKAYDSMRKGHPIAYTKLGMTFADISEDLLNTFLKENASQFNKILFDEVEKLDYEP